MPSFEREALLGSSWLLSETRNQPGVREIKRFRTFFYAQQEEEVSRETQNPKTPKD
jgi:hypothetical protein